MSEPAFDTRQLVTSKLFKDVDLEFIEHLLTQCQVLQMDSGEKLTVGAETPITFYLVLEGELHDTEGKSFVHGQTFGEENLLYHNLHSYVVEAVTPTRLLVLLEDDFWRMVSLDQQLVRNLTRGLLREGTSARHHAIARYWIPASAALILLAAMVIAGFRYAESSTPGPAGSSFEQIAVEGAVEGAGDGQRFTVTTHPVDDWLRIRGTVQPIRWDEVTAAVNAQVAEMNFAYGDKVIASQPLMVLSSLEAESKRRDAQSQVIRAEQEVNQLKTWKSSPDVRRAERDLLRTGDELKRTEEEVTSAQRLFDRGIISQQEFENTKSQREQKRIEQINAREALEATLKKGDATALHLAELQLANARQGLDAIDKELASTHIVSPETGIVFTAQDQGSGTDKKAASPLAVGSPVQVNQPLFAIADMQGISLEADVPEADMLALARGQSATVDFESLPGVELKGAIDYVAGRGTSKEYQGTVFRVRVAVPDLTDDQRRRLRIGMSASAMVLTYHKDDAIVVPFEAVTVENGQYLVHKRVGDEWKTMPVQIRGTRVDGIEITSGLAAGDELMLAAHSENAQ